jgi:hypothetical protein
MAEQASVSVPENLVRCEVIGPLPIVCVKTGNDIVKPDEVYLDTEHTNIPALVSAGHVKVLPKAKV